MVSVKFVSVSLLFVTLSFCQLGMAQGSKILPKKERKISIHSENNQVVDATTLPPTQYLNGDVKLYHAKTFMYCDSAVLRGNFLRMKHRVVLMQNDSIRIYGDSLRYNGDSLVAYLYGDIILENGPTKKLYTSYIRYDVANKIAYYTRNAKLIDGTSTLVSKQGRYDLNAKTAYFFDNVQARGEKFFMVSDSMAYNTDLKKVIFLAPTRIQQDSSLIYCESGWFDTNLNLGKFVDHAQYLSGKTLAKADTLIYDSQLDLITLVSVDSVSTYISETDTAYAFTIKYDKKNEDFTLNKSANYKSKENEVIGDKVFYNKKTEKFKTLGRAIVSDPPYLIEADTLDYDKGRKYGEGHGRVIWQDTSVKSTLEADHAFVDQSNAKMRAYNDIGRPSFSSEQDGDKMMLKADTLRSIQRIKERIVIQKKLSDRELRKLELERSKKSDSLTTHVMPVITVPVPEVKIDSITNQDTIFTGIMDTIVYIIGDNNVRIFKSDMQAIADSMVFNRRDSIITMFSSPFMWSDSSQIQADTIDIFLKKGKVDKLIARSDATIINSDDGEFYNQIKGQIMQGFFKEGKMDHLDVEGNAQIVYYMKDDANAYMGVNTTESSTMTFYFENKKITDIKCFVLPKSRVLPMDEANHEKIKISNFLWNRQYRPQSFDDL